MDGDYMGRRKRVLEIMAEGFEEIDMPRSASILRLGGGEDEIFEAAVADLRLNTDLSADDAGYALLAGIAYGRALELLTELGEEAAAPVVYGEH